MLHVRTPRRRLAVAVTAVLAVTSAGITVPAVAAPLSGTVAAASASAEQDLGAFSLPAGSRLASFGPSGFLTVVPATSPALPEFRWTGYESGVTTPLPPGSYFGSPGTDLAVTSAGSVHTLHDLATGADVVIDTTALGPDATLRRVIGSALVLRKPNATGGTDVHLVSKPEDTVLNRKVTGLPANASVQRFELSSTDTLILTYTLPGTPGRHLALVDVATGTVVEDRALPLLTDKGDVSTSATRVVWTEISGQGAVTLAVARRGDTTTAPTRIPLGSGSVQAEPLGDDWVTYGVNAEGVTWNPNFPPNPLHGLTARSLTTGKTVKVLDSVQRVLSEADGKQLVRGGTAAHGEGIYRIAPGPDGTPVATLVARTGEPTAVGAVARTVPTVVDFSGGQDAEWVWDVDRGNVEIRLQLTHTASGKRWNSEPTFLDRAYVSGVTWTGMFDDRTSAYNGAYTWRMTARPTDGIGPTLEKTGALTVANKPAPHDFSDSGAPDLLVRDSAGRLVGYDARQTLYETGHWGTPSKRERVGYGAGWNIYDRVTAAGNIAGSVHADILGRDKTGVLWLYQGTGKTFLTRTRIGGGWQTYDKLAAGSDLNGDGRPDLVATDKTGVMYLYKGTGKASAPYANRIRLGAGWGIYNQITATGNIAGAPAGDLLARDKAGVLWMYLGNGNGTFAGRIRVGGGWDRYSDIVGVGDLNRDGRNDLVVQGVAGGTYETLAFYNGTGDWRAPFGSRQGVYNPDDLGTGAVNLF
ncbi:VCBS repeat-containing protein [Streptomyces sp. NPDC006482]|uniref:FG-GAP repeat domain-containing protein n=1 Tax=Streptomyces sp. NPDC006482 TaxID=3154306 RepID=UPI0033B86058